MARLPTSVAWCWLGLVPAWALGCTADTSSSQQASLDEQRTRVFTVDDGWLDIETEYLPRVCTQENGHAAYLALEAQVIAARTYLLRHMRDDPALGTPNKPVVNGESFQAYAATANAGCVQASNATRGVVALYQGELIVANYVAGALVRTDGNLGKDLTHTERFVTYNEGRSGSDVIPAPKPIALPERTDNRGCMGQNRADYLARNGYPTDEILRYFYGADLTLTSPTASGPACGAIPSSGTCSGTVLTWCSEGVVDTFDCALTGGTCEVQSNGAAGCTDPVDSSSACGAVSYEGECAGDTLRWCTDYGQLVVRDCAEAGLTCALNGSASGGYDCLPAVEGTCAEGTVEPQCAGTFYLRCSAGNIAYIDCASIGLACAYFHESVGCYEVVPHED